MNPNDNPSNSSFPPPDHPLLAELADKPRRPWFAVIAGLLLILFVVGLVVGPLLYFALPGEMARWKIASAEEKRLNGDFKGAIAEINKALEKDPENAQLLRTRAMWQLERGELNEALKDANELVRLQPNDSRSYEFRMQVFWKMGRHKDSVADGKRLMEIDNGRSEMQRVQALNGLAYARALANMEIDEALADIDEAIRRAGELYSLVDTRGYLYYRQGDLDRALHDLDRAVENAEEEYEANLALAKEGRLGTTDARRLEEIIKEIAQPLAVIRYHRSLVHEARGESEKAEEDRKRVRELGFEPNDQLY